LYYCELYAIITVSSLLLPLSISLLLLIIVIIAIIRHCHCHCGITFNATYILINVTLLLTEVAPHSYSVCGSKTKLYLYLFADWILYFDLIVNEATQVSSTSLSFHSFRMKIS